MGSAMQASDAPSLLSDGLKLLVRHLSGGLAPTLLDREFGHRCDAIPSLLQGAEGRGETGSKRTDYARPDDSYARTRGFPVGIVKCQNCNPLIFAIPVAFSSEAL
jgi:hypothetical protein